MYCHLQVMRTQSACILFVTSFLVNINSGHDMNALQSWKRLHRNPCSFSKDQMGVGGVPSLGFATI